MFSWFWEFLYSISSTLFRLIDGLVLCANKLCGIDTINFNGEEKDFLAYLLFSKEIGFAFRVSAILATILLVVFTVFMVIRSIAKDKAEGTPAQIVIKAFKTILMFFLIPLVIVAFMTIGNAFVSALSRATIQSAASPGTFLFSAFAADGGMNPDAVARFRTGELSYVSVNTVSTYMNLSDFPFIFSFIAGGVVLFGVGSAMLIFVDRILSLVILYLASPISLASSVLDDGARFKLWRDQFLSKFVMGYGMILAINIYALVCGLVTSPGFAFFSGDDSTSKFLDLIMKLLVIAGGALTMQKSMAVIGNLVSSGAGSNELRDNALSMGKLARMAAGGAGFVAGKALSAAGYMTGAKALKSIAGDAISAQSRHLGQRALRGLGLGGGYPKEDKKDGKDGGSDSHNSEKANYGSKDDTKNAITGDEGFKRSFDSTNNNKNGNNENSLNKAINGDGNKNKGNSNDGGRTDNKTEQNQNNGGA